jgi:hypothetical protein
MTQSLNHESIESYFLKLADYGRGLLDRLPIELEPQPLEYALGKLAPLLEERRAEEIARLRQIVRPAPVCDTGSSPAIGLNTVGMLTDRFTILLIKEWCLRHKAGTNPAKADDLFKMQTLEIISALVDSRPGSSSLNSKITSIKSGVSAADWEESFWGLLTTNLLMWESQEMLYIKDISQAPYEELRAYVSWFSKSNIQRNAYIELCEKRYWQMTGERR